MTTTVLDQGSTVARAASMTHYQTLKVDGVNIFYREAGPADAPVVLTTPSTALLSLSTACLSSLASPVMRCMSWITVLRWVGA